MRIVLEGVDGVGKTTLAKILAYKYNLDICHCTQYDASDYNFYKQTLRKENVIWDRHTIGELIYPTIFNRKQQVSIEEVEDILNFAKLENIKVFVLTTDMDKIKDRLSKRGNENKHILDNLDWINEQFKLYANKFNVKIIDTSKMTLEEIFNLIEGDNN